MGPKLVPFFKTLTIYFVLFAEEPRLESPLYCAIKCLPVISLMFFVLLHGMSFSEYYSYSRKVTVYMLDIYYCSMIELQQLLHEVMLCGDRQVIVYHTEQEMSSKTFESENPVENYIVFIFVLFRYTIFRLYGLDLVMFKVNVIQ